MAAEERPRGLGRGLSALIGEEAVPTRGESAAARATHKLPVAFLRPNKLQPRKRFASEELNDLADSIREKGVLQPILVRPVKGEANAFEIVAGERRWRAAQIAKLHEVPVVVREMGDSESLEIAIIENVQRADLNAIEEAAAYYELMERFNFTQERVAKEVGKSRSHIANTLRLLTLPESVRSLVREGKLSAGHARTLVGLADAERRAHDIIVGMLNVRQSEQRSGDKKTPSGGSTKKDADTIDLESKLSNALGLTVKVLDKGRKGGEVRIVYKTLEQLDEIARRLSNGR
jgi:ParB family transcriptional regulator, chromosome partitioning protein